MNVPGNSEIVTSELPSNNFENKFLQYDAQDSRSHNSWQIEESALSNSAILVSILVPVSWQFQVMTEISFLEEVKFQKTVPEIPILFRESSGNPESRLSIPLGLGILEGWLGTWDAPEVLAVSGCLTSSLGCMI